MTAGYYRHDVGSRMSFAGAAHLFAAMTHRAAVVWVSTTRTARKTAKSESLPTWAAVTLYSLALSGLWTWAMIATGAFWMVAIVGGMLIFMIVPLWYMIIFGLFGPFVIPYRLHARNQRRSAAQQQQMVNLLKQQKKLQQKK